LALTGQYSGAHDPLRCIAVVVQASKVRPIQGLYLTLWAVISRCTIFREWLKQMKEIGFVILAIGALVLGYSGFVGLETGRDGFRVANFGGMFVGTALLISGSIFAVGGAILEQLRSMNGHASSQINKAIETSTPTQYRPSDVSSSADEIVKNYKGYKIRKAPNWASTGEFLIGDTRVQGVIAAEKHINGLLDGHE